MDWQREEQWRERPCGHVQMGNKKFLMGKTQKLVPSKKKEAKWHLGIHLGAARDWERSPGWRMMPSPVLPEDLFIRSLTVHPDTFVCSFSRYLGGISLVAGSVLGARGCFGEPDRQGFCSHQDSSPSRE